ncbi:IucA/IucC family siderophore biosynthesis protein [Halobacillus sp. A5]|uniref:IucA/IucC family protein n=1 Tax=Halobacillus sp. A5 TaxID=2880263 RepID=UPI0020A6B784|nr:IucA/IucC family siderophore biosynthesis protein [Halobacillus sp. A5]MCP3028206.1 IucA/IucC family siderophore biosynthesis protein [Halobacillus sp. A5]
MLYAETINSVLEQNEWTKVNQELLAKMISEYMYEDMLHPNKLNEAVWAEYQLTITSEKYYRYNAKSHYFDSYQVDARSIMIVEGQKERKAVSAIEFLLDVQPLIGMSAETAGHLVKELNHTLLADAHQLKDNSTSSDRLIMQDYAQLEGEMSGHPWITYNKGRIGFGYDDYLNYAPERQNSVRLLWLAVHKKTASFQSVEGLSYNHIIQEELSDQEIEDFWNQIQAHDAAVKDYFLIPIHEWQWKNVIIQQYPDDLAQSLIIPLGTGEDHYLPQQSIRTFVNQDHPLKKHVKIPMSILNTLVYRGLPAERTLIAPQITEFIKGIYERDSFLKEECRVILPGEVASINVPHKYYDQLKNAPYQYLEMLGVIWRESIYSYLEEGEQAITLAALLHIDKKGKPYIQSLIENSTLAEEEWMEKFFKIVMDPLLHFLYQYGTVFSPHGQNTILILKDSQPHRLAVKDFVDDVNISDQPFKELEGLTDEIKSVLRSEPPEGLTQFIFTGLFICHLRYLARIMDNHNLMEEKHFWNKLANAIHAYQSKFPHLKERFETFDFFKEEFTKLCLNRNRMVDYGYGDGDDRPHASEYGKVKNVLALWKK